MDIQDLVKQTLKYPFRPRVDYPIIIAGLGRCGTTMVHDAIYRRTRNRNTFANSLDSVSDFGSDVVKTHDYPPTRPLPPDCRVVFMFGDVVNTIISTCRNINDWGSKHFEHLHTTREFTPYDQLYREDLLELEKMWDAWHQPQSFRFMTLRYETMYEPEPQRMLKEFLGFDPELPAFRPRKAKKDADPLAEIAKHTYADLSAKLRAAEDCKIWEAKKS